MQKQPLVRWISLGAIGLFVLYAFFAHVFERRALIRERSAEVVASIETVKAEYITVTEQWLSAQTASGFTQAEQTAFTHVEEALAALKAAETPLDSIESVRVLVKEIWAFMNTVGKDEPLREQTAFRIFEEKVGKTSKAKQLLGTYNDRARAWNVVADEGMGMLVNGDGLPPTHYPIFTFQGTQDEVPIIRL